MLMILVLNRMQGRGDEFKAHWRAHANPSSPVTSKPGRVSSAAR